MDFDEFKVRLAHLELQDWKIQTVLATELAREQQDLRTTKTEEVRAYGYSTALRRYEDGLSSASDLENELRMLGYTTQQIERYKIVANLERDRRYANALLSTLRTAWDKGKIGDDTFIGMLRAYGFEEWKIQFELNLLKLKRGVFLVEGGEES